MVVSESGCGIASANNLSCLARPQVQFHNEVRNAHKRVGSILVMTNRRCCCSHNVLGATKVTFHGFLQQKPWTGHLASVINSRCPLEGFHILYLFQCSPRVQNLTPCTVLWMQLCPAEHGWMDLPGKRLKV